MDPRWRRAAVGGAIGIALLVVLAIVAPEIYSGTFSDTGTFLRVALVVVVLAGWAMLVKRFVRQPALATALAVVPMLVAIWIYVWPYVRPATEVDEAFPPVAGVDASPESTGAPPSATDAVTTTASTAPPPTTDPPSASPATTAAPDATQPPTTPPPTAPPTTAVPTTTVPPGPVELRRATFRGLTGHRGSGDAAVYRLADNSILLRFEDVDIGSGPDLVVYLVPGEDRRGLGDAVRVAGLTAERGNQNYDVPAGVDITSGTWTVLVWCTTFAVEVANATLTG